MASTWHPGDDTTEDPIINSRRPQPCTSWQRCEDYYREGQLGWIDADTLIRSRSGGKRSLDDFAKAFFGIENGNWSERLYTFDDMQTRLLDAFRHPSTGEAAKQRLRDRFPLVLVDEFQDTDPVQWEILRESFVGHASVEIGSAPV